VSSFVISFVQIHASSSSLQKKKNTIIRRREEEEDNCEENDYNSEKKDNFTYVKSSQEIRRSYFNV
jgi:hypothetical protein